MAASKAPTVVDKGGHAEEALRQYFKELGSYVLRGVPVKEGAETVTDIDLWVYTRTSPLSRHIAIVDIKNKKKGKAFERAVWVKGLQIALQADEAIIASQGAKDSVHSFAVRMNVRVLSSSIFEAIVKRFPDPQDRLSAEDVDQQWRSVALGVENIKARVDLCKVEISRGISFQALNAWIDEAASLLKLMVERERNGPGPITRAVYFVCSLISIGSDFLGREHALSDHLMRREHFRQGLLFGRTDGSSGKSYLDFAQSLATEFFDPSGAAAAQMRAGFENAVKDMPIEGLVDLFAKPNSGSELMKAALSLESASFASQLTRPADLGSSEAKAIIGLLSDFAGLRRSDVLGQKDGGLARVVDVGKQGTLPV